MKKIFIVLVVVLYGFTSDAQNPCDHRKYSVPDVIGNTEIHYYASLCIFHYSEDSCQEYMIISGWQNYDFLFHYNEADDMWRKIKIANDSIYQISDLINQTDSSKYCNDVSLKIKCETKENLFKVFIYCPSADTLKEEER